MTPSIQSNPIPPVSLAAARQEAARKGQKTPAGPGPRGPGAGPPGPRPFLRPTRRQSKGDCRSLSRSCTCRSTLRTPRPFQTPSPPAARLPSCFSCFLPVPRSPVSHLPPTFPSLSGRSTCAFFASSKLPINLAYY